MRRFADSAAYRLGRANARFQNLAAVARVIAAVYIAARQIDHDIRTLQFLAPIARIAAVPHHSPPWRAPRTPRENRDRVARTVEMRGQHLPHLAAAAGNDDLHDSSITVRMRSTSMRCTGRISGKAASLTSRSTIAALFPINARVRACAGDRS